MLALLLYGLFVLLLSGFTVAAIFNFLRYRYQGDKTMLIIILFLIGFAISVGFTLSLLQSTDIPTNQFSSFQ